jgi:hypothetical protein
MCTKFDGDNPEIAELVMTNFWYSYDEQYMEEQELKL